MVKALFPIGKTQWAKWDNMQRRAFNTLREQGKDFDTAVALANTMVDVFEEFKPQPKKKNIFDKIEDAVEDVVEVAETVTSVAAAVTPVVSVAKTVARATSKKKAK